MSAPGFVKPPKPSHLVYIFTSPIWGNWCGQDRCTEHPRKSDNALGLFSTVLTVLALDFDRPNGVSEFPDNLFHFRPNLDPEWFFDWQCFQPSFLLLQACFEQAMRRRCPEGTPKNKTPENPFENTLSQWILRDFTRFCHNIIDKSLLGMVQIQVPGTLSSAPRAEPGAHLNMKKIPEQPVLVDGSMGQGNDFDIPNFEQHSPDRNPSAMASPATARTQEHIRSMTHCGTIKLGPNVL